jgi:Ala-tRNA(Pro) deacylase
MEVRMNLQSFLDDQGVHYRMSQHSPAFTSQDLAAAEHVPGRNVIKPVVVRADGQWVMCALPASHRVDLRELREQLRANDVILADEQSLERLFPECELGAEPPIGTLFGMPTLMDESLVADDMVTFQAGTHTDAVTMPLTEYRRISNAEIAHFGRHV